MNRSVLLIGSLVLSVLASTTARSASWPAPYGPVDAESVKATLFANRKLDPVEGLWSFSDNSYQIAIVKSEAGKFPGWDYVAVVVDTNVRRWKRGELKAYIRSTANPGVYTLDVFLGDKSRHGTTMVSKADGTLSFYIPGSIYTPPIETLLLKNWPDARRGGADSRGTRGTTVATGFVVASGYVVTAFHAIAGAEQVQIVSDGATYDTTVLSRDYSNDLAVLAVTGPADALARFKSIPALPMGEAVKVVEGERMQTIGFPLIDELGGRPRITEGIVSAVTGLYDDPTNFQISVPVQPGNSGGPLINRRGEVVGVVLSQLPSWKQLVERGSIPQNVNFAVKINYVQNLFALTPSLQNVRFQTAHDGRAMEPDQVMAKYKASIVLVKAK